jgi:hypothetical protein
MDRACAAPGPRARRARRARMELHRREDARVGDQPARGAAARARGAQARGARKGRPGRRRDVERAGAGAGARAPTGGPSRAGSCTTTAESAEAEGADDGGADAHEGVRRQVRLALGRAPMLAPDRPRARLAAMLAADTKATLHPDVDTPFADAADAVKRLLPYHIWQHPQEDLEALKWPGRLKGKGRATEAEIAKAELAGVPRLQTASYGMQLRTAQKPGSPSNARSGAERSRPTSGEYVPDRAPWVPTFSAPSLPQPYHSAARQTT